MNTNNLIGKKIVKARYMTETESYNLGCHKKGIILILDDGSMLCPFADDEMNDSGTIAVFKQGQFDHLIPTQY